jgi:hypothetical protein
MALVHRPSAWASTKFSVTLSDGVLTAVNADSDAPAKEFVRALTSLVTAASPIVIPSKVEPTTALPLCNADPRIASINGAKVN